MLYPPDGARSDLEFEMSGGFRSFLLLKKRRYYCSHRKLTLFCSRLLNINHIRLDQPYGITMSL